MGGPELPQLKVQPSCSIAFDVRISNAAELDLKRPSKGRRDPRLSEARARGTECCRALGPQRMGPLCQIGRSKVGSHLRKAGMLHARVWVPYGAGLFSGIDVAPLHDPLPRHIRAKRSPCREGHECRAPSTRPWTDQRWRSIDTCSAHAPGASIRND
jgi:hypothetical protein